MISLRRMQVEDIAEVFRIDSTSEALYWPERSYHFEVEENQASRPWVAVDENNSVLGFLVIWVIVDEVHIANFVVEPNHRSQGIGTKLLTNALLCAWEEGARVSFLEVRAGNQAALRIYHRCGYSEVGVRKQYYQDNKEDALLLNLETPAYQTFVTQNCVVSQRRKNESNS